MWCVWTLLALGIVALLAIVGLRFLRRAVRTHIRSEFVEFLKEERPDFTVVGVDASYLDLERGGEPGRMYLDKLYAAVLSADTNTSEERRAIYDHFLRSLTEVADAGDDELTMEDHGERIMPRLVRPEFLTQLPPDSGMPHTPLAGTGLEVVYVLDAPNSVMYITGAHASDLGLDAAGLHELALTNLSRTFPVEMVRQAVEGDALPMFKAMDSFDAARVLLVPRHLQPGETLVALIPDRDTLALASLPKDDDWSGLRKLARTPGGDHLLLDRPLKVTAAGFEVV